MSKSDVSRCQAVSGVFVSLPQFLTWAGNITIITYLREATEATAQTLASEFRSLHFLSEPCEPFSCEPCEPVSHVNHVVMATQKVIT